ncbi:MAG: PQQ-binding-like beta-propeller repeat protein, partial [Hyphomicrobiales bacterium]
FSTGIDNALRAFKRTNGKLNWRSKLPEIKTNGTATRWSRPILAGGRLHLASNTGYVASFNADDGKLILLRNINAPINSAPIVASGRLYIIAANGKVFRL